MMLNKLRLLTPGPTPLPEQVRLALSKDMIHHRKAEFGKIMERCQANLRALFGTTHPVLPLACSGTGAMTAAIYGLFNPGEKVLVIEAGKFGQRWSEIALSRKLETHKLEVPWGEAVKAEQVADILAKDKNIAGVLMQLCETSTGALMPVEKIAEWVNRTEALLVVDGVSAVGISPCPMDAWNIDCLLTGSQKGLMLPPGLALLACSQKAWEKAEKVEPGCFYFDLLKERRMVQTGQNNFTSPVNLIFGLDASLEFLLQNGLEAIYVKQWALTMLVRAGCKAMGLKLFAPEAFAWGITSALLPEGCDGIKILKDLQDNYGICLAGGQDSLKGKIVRIGHMGWVDWGDCIAALAALADVLRASGNFHPGEGFIEKAMNAYSLALISPPGTMPAH